MDSNLTYDIIGAAIEVHRTLGGPGLIESIYEEALCHEFSLRNISFQKQQLVDVQYKGVSIKNPLCLDIIVNKQVIIELKATEKMHTIHETQLLTYLRLTGLKVGLVINFGQKNIKEGVTRIINDRIAKW